MELLVVIAIIGVMAVIVASLGRGATLKSKFTSEINNFLANFNQVRNRAASENRTFAIVFDNSGTFYTIQRQVDITDINTFAEVGFDQERPLGHRIYPLRGQSHPECFLAGEVQSFAINSMGEVRHFPLVANDLPTSVQLNFFIHDASGARAYQDQITIYPYGGVRVDKVNL